MSKHTPGPWKVDNRYTWPEEKIIITDQHGVEIAKTNDTFRSEDFAKRRTTANAHLISAAPELLEALEDLIKRFGRAELADFDLSKQQKAIAKARGES